MAGKCAELRDFSNCLKNKKVALKNSYWVCTLEVPCAFKERKYENVLRKNKYSKPGEKLKWISICKSPLAQKIMETAEKC